MVYVVELGRPNLPCYTDVTTVYIIVSMLKLYIL